MKTSRVNAVSVPQMTILPYLRCVRHGLGGATAIFGLWGYTVFAIARLSSCAMRRIVAVMGFQFFNSWATV